VGVTVPANKLAQTRKLAQLQCWRIAREVPQFPLVFF
jgi:hypothetical protein